MLINRMYYTVPALRESGLELFVFFEEKRFLKAVLRIFKRKLVRELSVEFFDACYT